MHRNYADWIEIESSSGSERREARVGAHRLHLLDHEPFAALDESERRTVVRLAAILRVADALDREHRQAVRAATVRREGSKTVLALKGEGDFALEDWAVRNKGGLFCRTFSTTLELKAEES